MQSTSQQPGKHYLGQGLGLILCVVLAFVIVSADKTAKEGDPKPVTLIARHILFSDRADGGILIRDATTGQMIGEIAPGEGGFVRGALRGFTRELRLEKPGAESPLRLAALEGGALILQEPTSGRWTDLRAFGSTNMRSFAEILFKKAEEEQ